MSKKLRKNSSKPATRTTVSNTSGTVAKKVARSVAAAPAKKPTKKSKAKAPAQKPVAKATRPVKAAPHALQKVEMKEVKPARAVKSAGPNPPMTTSAKASSPRSPLAAKSALQSAPAIATEGAVAPAFTLPRDGGASVSLGDFAGQKLVIFFYPRADTPGCTKEAIDFTRLASTFAASKTAILGVSADPLKAQEAFRDKHDLSVPLLSDETHAMLEAYGAWGEKSMYGRTFLGVLRTTVLIAPNGIVAKIWRNVKVDGHADEVLDVARGL